MLKTKQDRKGYSSKTNIYWEKTITSHTQLCTESLQNQIKPLSAKRWHHKHTTRRKKKKKKQSLCSNNVIFIEVVIYVRCYHEVRSALRQPVVVIVTARLNQPLLCASQFNIHGCLRVGLALLSGSAKQLKLGETVSLSVEQGMLMSEIFPSALHSGRISVRWVTQLSKIAVTQFQDQTHSQWETGFEPKGRERSQVTPLTLQTRTTRGE